MYSDNNEVISLRTQMAGIISPIASALQGAKCQSTDSIAVKLC